MHARLITVQQRKVDNDMGHKRSYVKNDRSGGVEGLSRPRRGRVPKTEKDAAHAAACEPFVVAAKDFHMQCAERG